MKLGRLPKRHDPRTLAFARYTASPLISIPDTYNWGTLRDDWGMMLNDKLGNCTIAAAGHIIMNGTARNGGIIILTDEEIVSAYSAVSGYVPGRTDTDTGAVELNVLNYWRNRGIGGHNILGYVSLDTSNMLQIKEAIYLFGNVYAGIDMPLSAQDQTNVGMPWSVISGARADSGSWGGHAVPLLGYDTDVLECVTWGQQQWMTLDWWKTYATEAYALISADWCPPSGVSPSHFNLAQLQSDLAQL